MLSHPHSEKVFLDIQNLLWLSLSPLPLALSLGITEKSLALSSLQDPSLSLLFSWLNSPSPQHFLTVEYSSPFITLDTPCFNPSISSIPISLVLVSLTSDTAHQAKGKEG